ncbi:MAG: hypothetical protein JKY67_00190 [Pseudomonadales bacterium]|nr:hypothetical protein [Pseudomonadales bacterium]
MTNRKVIGTWVDPPSGWRYGFPRIKECNTPTSEWLIENGYPEKEVSFACENCRSWIAYEGDTDD